MRLKTTLFAAAATIAITPAAHAYEGLYGAIGAGINYMQPDTDVSNDGDAGMGMFAFDSDADYKNGIGMYAALGKAFGNGFRAELEFSYRSNDIRHIASDGAGFSGWPASTLQGDMKSYTGMFNLLYDFETTSKVTPYVGVGLGIAGVDPDFTGNNTSGAPTPALTIGNFGATTAMAYQGIVGLGFALADNLTLDVSYRYFGTDKRHFSSTLNGAPANIAVENTSHSLFAGLRWNFGATPPPPVQYKDCWDGSSVPMTSECPPQVVEEQTVDLEPVSFTVYFDYDKYNLTPQAQTLVAEASSRALQNDINTVVVSGNTDTAGSSAYNQMLSERRAKVVRDALIANGVPAGDIRIEANGESNPAKPTADGVREPLNRRSDVVISFE